MNVAEEVEKSSKSSGGHCCLFVQLSNSEGVKFYHTKKIRDQAANAQRKASNLKLGPRVGEFCEMPALQSWHWPHRWPLETTKVYGYITQVAEIRVLTVEEFDYLQTALIYNSFDVADIDYAFNVGVIDGMPVCIDFDPFPVC